MLILTLMAAQRLPLKKSSIEIKLFSLTLYAGGFDPELSSKIPFSWRKKYKIIYKMMIFFGTLKEHFF